MIAQARAPLWRTTFVVASRNRPRQHGLDLCRQLAARSPATRQSIPAAGERCASTVERVGEGESPVALDGLAHLGQRLSGDALDLRHLRRGATRVALGSSFVASSLLSAIRDRRVAEQVVQVAGDPQALLGDGQRGRAPRAPRQLAVGRASASPNAAISAPIARIVSAYAATVEPSEPATARPIATAAAVTPVTTAAIRGGSSRPAAATT